MIHPACQSIDELTSDCDFRRTRGSGPGGQHRNKVETAIVVLHRPTGIRATASERRSQQQNKEVAIERLRIQLAIQVRRPAANPSELWQSRVQSGRVHLSRHHKDFPAMLAEAMDHIYQSEFQISVAAKQLNCSTSQLVKLIKLEDAAWQRLNIERQKAGMGPLK